MTKTMRSTPCPDCQGRGFRDHVPCQRCGGIGQLYKLATASAASSSSQGESETHSWLSAAMLASALGKDPVDAAVIAAITGNAPLGILLAGDDGQGQQPARDDEPPLPDPAPSDNNSGSERDAPLDDASGGGEGD